jgi:predicted permease
MMQAIQEAVSRLRAVFRRDRLDQDFNDELATHLALLTEQNRRRGLPEAEARRQAIVKMGGVTQTQNLHREARGLPRIEHALHAWIHAWRSWQHAKGVALMAAAALALGIGSATAIYSVVNAAMLRPLPYQHGDRLVAVFAGNMNDPQRHEALQSEDAERILERNRSFDAFGWFRGAGKNLMVAGEPYHVGGVSVTVPLVHALGVAPALGRWFEDDTGVVLSNVLWQRLGGSPKILGQVVTLDGKSYIVTGVMPEWFRLPVAGMTWTGVATDVWMPLDPRERAGAAYFAYGRLRPDVSLTVVEEDLRRIAAEIVSEDGSRRAGYAARAMSLGDTVSRTVRPTLVLLLGAAGLLFLITCANAAGLLLARAVSRSPETALRVALGAGTGRLALQYLAESLLISFAGAAGGVLLSVIVTPVIVSMAEGYVPRADEIAVNWSVLAFALGAAIVASVLASLTPLWQAVRTCPADILRDGFRTSAGTRSRGMSRSLVVAEIALAFALLAAGGTLMVHVRDLARENPGFDAQHLLTFVVSLPGEVASDAAQRRPLQRRLLEAVAAIPGVEDVAFANSLPMKGCCWSTTILPDAGSIELDPSAPPHLMLVSGAYFRTMRIPLRSGRGFTDEHVVASPGVIPVVVSESFAQRYWPDRNALGAYGRFEGPDGTRFSVVGVVADVKNEGLDIPSVPVIYRPAVWSRVETMRFVVRSAGSEASLAPDVMRQVRGIDPTQPVHDQATMTSIIDGTMTLERAVSLTTRLFAGAALLLAMVGVYGVLSYSVRQQTVEIGMRMALGATTGSVFSMVVRSGLKLAAVGILAGAFAAIAVVSYLGSVFPLGDTDLSPYFYSMALVMLVASAASIVPAWRATLMSPLVAIRKCT